MNAITHDTFGLDSRPVRTSTFRLPPAPPAPKGRGQGPLRELLSLVSRRSESYAFRWDDGAWNYETTDRAMFDGQLSALDVFGITLDHRIEQTDSPVKFDVLSRDGTKRRLEIVWDSISDDIMSMPPHVKPYSGALSLGLMVGACAASWGGIYGVLKVFDVI